ncbi:hypothetical protein A8L34_00200 [Bacillus sp. FJAT-27264]|uniref:hypothetical protein n=1 Tax=Paenibacillus sp. (strain DSM 101736 / FJAT-27264) TaxID=1850362 RepID=UPI000807A692|nr:hypothetical protein [Bacillus sp. FJAT-27264]OBZ18050.1 hypothetical protein A8L34_00200 [Bacillus sp. FJAT-27264]
MNSKVLKNRFYDDLQNANQFAELENILLSESNLPGPRANLEIADTFANAFASSMVTSEAWNLILKWIDQTGADAPINTPCEFLPFCALQAMGAYFYYAELTRKQIILEKCQAAMNDDRWRMREAAAMALQRIGEREFNVIQSLFDSIALQANPLEKRAFVATLAHPPLLKEPSHVLYALQLSEQILDEITAGQVNYIAEDYRVLSKGLEYAVSLFVERAPEAGFALLAKFAGSGDKRIQKIVKSNLGKARLAKKFSQEVEQIQRLLNG